MRYGISRFSSPYQHAMSSTIPPPTTTLNHRTPCPPPLFENALPPPSNPYPPRRNSSNRHSPAAEQPQRWMAGGGSEEVSPGGRGRGGHEDRRSTQAESSGDEITPLASRERGSASGRNYSSTGAKAGDVAGNERVVDTGTGEAGNRRGRRRDGDGNGNGDGEDEKEGWWTRVVEKFGSVELDNKGSVARDHLALGMLRSLHCMSTAFVSSSSSPHTLRSLSLLPILPHPSHIHFLSLSLPHPPPYQRLTRQRTYLPSLAPHLPLLRRHRHRHHPALPPQHHHPATRRLRPLQPTQHVPSAPARQAVGRYVLGNRDHGAGGWGQTIF